MRQAEPDDPEIEAIFLREARTRVDDLVLTLASEIEDAHYALFRHAHSLKGIAEMTGHEDVARLAEGIVGRVRDRNGNPTKPTAADERALREDVERLWTEVGKLTQGTA